MTGKGGIHNIFALGTAGVATFPQDVRGSANIELLGTIQAGTAFGTADVNFYREAAGKWKTDHSLTVAGTLELESTTPDFRWTETSEADPDGRFRWRAAGNEFDIERKIGTPDTWENLIYFDSSGVNLNRPAVAWEDFTIKGTPSFPGMPGTAGMTGDGDMGFSAAGSKLYIRQSGTIYEFTASAVYTP